MKPSFSRKINLKMNLLKMPLIVFIAVGLLVSAGNLVVHQVEASGPVGSDIPGTSLALGASQNSVVDKATKPRDVYAMSLSGGQEVQIEVTDYPGQLNFILAAPSSTSFDGNRYTTVFNSLGQSTYSPWSYTYTPSTSGTYYFAVNAWESGSQPYTISAVATGTIYGAGNPGQGGISPSTPALQRTPPTITLYSPTINGLMVSINGVALATTQGASITVMNWQWGDGSTSNGFFPQTHTYNQGGTYTVTVTVTDNNGLSVSASKTVTVGTGGTSVPTGTTQNPPFALNGAYTTYKITYGYPGFNFNGVSVNGGSINGGVSFKISNVDTVAQTFNVTTSYNGNLSGLNIMGSNSSASFSSPSPFPAVSQSDLQMLHQGQAPPDFSGGTVTTGVSVSVPAGRFKTDEVATPDGNTVWVDMTSGLIVKQTGALLTLPGATMALQNTNIATSKSSSFIIIIAVIVAVIVIAGVVALLMVRRRKSIKSGVTVAEPIKQTTAKITPMAKTPGTEASDPTDRLQRLKVMLDKGLITQQDYDEQKKKILEEYTK